LDITAQELRSFGLGIIGFIRETLRLEHYRPAGGFCSLYSGMPMSIKASGQGRTKYTNYYARNFSFFNTYQLGIA